jgi:hypothetical protein
MVDTALLLMTLQEAHATDRSSFTLVAMQLLPKPKDKQVSSKIGQSSDARKEKPKIGARPIDDGIAKRRGTPIEDAFQLVTMLRIQLEGRRIGAYVLRKGEHSFMIQFGFECKGIHSTLRAEQIDPVFDVLEAGLKDFPQNEHLTIHLTSFTDDAVRQRELMELSNKAPSTELQFLVQSERVRVRELTKLGIRKPKTLRLYASYTVEPDTAGAADRIEKAIARLERMWKGFTGELEKVQFMRMEQLIAAAYTDGFQQWEQLLSNKIGLSKGKFPQHNASGLKPMVSTWA